MKTKLLLFLVLFATAGMAGAQDLNRSFNTTIVHSQILGSEREVSISLPPNYDQARYLQERYPVLYFFDGETSMGFYKAVTQFLSKGVYANIPEMILVGIKNKDRTNDLTPTRSFIKSPDDSTKRLFENSGGNEQFVQFIEKELFKYVNEHYRTNGYAILSGHSFGGLAASNILLHHTSLFNAYILIDPSIWWDNGYIAREAGRLVPPGKVKPAIVYMATANNKEKANGFDAGDNASQKLQELLSASQDSSFLFRYKFYEQEDHGTIPLPALYDGLKFIFEGYAIDFKEVTSYPSVIIDTYKAFSDRNHHVFIPSLQKFDFIVRYFKENKKMREAQIVLKQRRQLYPDAE